MKKTTLTLTLAALAVTTAALAAPAKPAPAAQKTALVCPISGEKIASASKAYAHETYKGKTYYFCCAACQPTFDKDPDKAIAAAAKGKHQPM